MKKQEVFVIIFDQTDSDADWGYSLTAQVLAQGNARGPIVDSPYT